MSDPISLHPVSQADRAVVATVAVHPDQLRFCGTVQQAYDANEDGVDFHAIWQGPVPVGFFKIDRLYADKYDFAAPGVLGLRAFMIDERCQGQGIAGRAIGLFPAYLAQHYPDAPAIALTVNLQNPAAIRCYQRAGFGDGNELYHGGPSGPQKIMRLSLTGQR